MRRESLSSSSLCWSQLLTSDLMFSRASLFSAKFPPLERARSNVRTEMFENKYFSCLLVLNLITLGLQHAVLSLQIVDILLVRVVLAAHKLDVFGGFLQNLSAARLR